MDLFLEKMRRIGMSENEAKVYQVLFRLKVATPREVHELSGVPRNKVYDCLTSLQKRGFIEASSTIPARYYLADVIKTFDRLKRDTQKAFEDAAEYLLMLECDPLENSRRSMQAYELNSTWAVENRVRMIFRHTRTELIILCRETGYLRKHIPDLRVFARDLQKERKVAFYLVVPTARDAADLGVRCYIPTKKLSELIDASGIPGVGEKTYPDISPKMMILSDNMEALGIVDAVGEAHGLYFFGGPQVKIMEKYILENICSSTDTEK